MAQPLNESETVPQEEAEELCVLQPDEEKELDGVNVGEPDAQLLMLPE